MRFWWVFIGGVFALSLALVCAARALGQATPPAPTYLEMMRHDIKRIVEALKR